MTSKWLDEGGATVVCTRAHVHTEVAQSASAPAHVQRCQSTGARAGIQRENNDQRMHHRSTSIVSSFKRVCLVCTTNHNKLSSLTAITERASMRLVNQCAQTPQADQSQTPTRTHRSPNPRATRTATSASGSHNDFTRRLRRTLLLNKQTSKQARKPRAPSQPTSQPARWTPV
jgi:hypothetical protein